MVMVLDLVHGEEINELNIQTLCVLVVVEVVVKMFDLFCLWCCMIIVMTWVIDYGGRRCYLWFICFYFLEYKERLIWLETVEKWL